jgi:hypothetical protein
MCLLRPLLGFARLDHQRNVDIKERLMKVTNSVEEIQGYQQNF